MLQLWSLQLFVSGQAIGGSRSGLLLAILVLGDEQVDMEEASKYGVHLQPHKHWRLRYCCLWPVRFMLSAPLSSEHCCCNKTSPGDMQKIL